MNRMLIFFLALSAALVSLVGASFSVSGLAKLFAGAPKAVMIMAGSLEFAKIVSASFLHRHWKRLHLLLKTYMTSAVIVLVLITSMGIFGYLSHAYQDTAVQLKNTMVRIEYFNNEDKKIQDELARLQKTVDEVPANRVTKRIEIQKELEPRFQELRKQSLGLQGQLREENLRKLTFQTEVGPIIYVAEAFHKDTDSVAHILILMFVVVFDPLAICLVLATGFALQIDEEETAQRKIKMAQQLKVVPPPAPAPAPESETKPETPPTAATG